jgi:hypothetical protein
LPIELNYDEDEEMMLHQANLIPMANGMDDDMDDEKTKTIDLRDKDANDTG